MSNNHTLFGQMLQLIPRYEFDKQVCRHKAEYHARGFSSWQQFSAMLFGQLAGQDSLRSIVAGLATNSSSLYHLGVKPLARSTLAYANEHRPAALYADLFQFMLSKCQAIAPRHDFRFKNPLYSLDATTIELCLSLYDWATFRSTKGAVKLHVKLNHRGYLPTFVTMTVGRVHEQRAAWAVPFEKDDVVVFDRGYSSFAWFKSLVDKGAYFVTRLKRGADYRVVERRDVSKQANITSDQTIELCGFYSRKKYPHRLRRVRAVDPVTGKSVVLLTNNFKWAAATIARIYKNRWQIELFFKTVKQLLQIKSFVGTSSNALLSQLWIALIAYLLLAFLKFKSKFSGSMYMLCAILPINLFSRRNLLDWLEDPYHKKGTQPVVSGQLELQFG